MIDPALNWFEIVALPLAIGMEVGVRLKELATDSKTQKAIGKTKEAT
jgi:hypothetical protein